MDDDELTREQAKIALFTDPAVRGRDALARASFDAELHYGRDGTPDARPSVRPLSVRRR